ncbi:hypothetical protein P7K49_016709 [Saguinus oedipus]|uniref:Uncharacterized protein n=1 Tax=Saguinus oedipus TaxID=9490 RepID=A0ABQ9VCV8_SAGOE|nr:hypothetical protein P7K49_016709 [Saguinus oedipus]
MSNYHKDYSPKIQKLLGLLNPNVCQYLGYLANVTIQLPPLPTVCVCTLEGEPGKQRQGERNLMRGPRGANAFSPKSPRYRMNQFPSSSPPPQDAEGHSEAKSGRGGPRALFEVTLETGCRVQECAGLSEAGKRSPAARSVRSELTRGLRGSRRTIPAADAHSQVMMMSDNAKDRAARSWKKRGSVSSFSNHEFRRKELHGHIKE